MSIISFESHNSPLIINEAMEAQLEKSHSFEFKTSFGSKGRMLAYFLVVSLNRSLLGRLGFGERRAQLRGEGVPGTGG